MDATDDKRFPRSVRVTEGRGDDGPPPDRVTYDQLSAHHGISQTAMEPRSEPDRVANDPGQHPECGDAGNDERNDGRCTSLLPKNRSERQPPQAPGGNRNSEDAAEDGAKQEEAEKTPGHGQMFGRRIKDVLEHRHEHLGE